MTPEHPTRRSRSRPSQRWPWRSANQPRGLGRRRIGKALGQGRGQRLGRRRIGKALRLAAALALAGGVYAVFAPGVSSAQDEPLSRGAQEGQALFAVNCASCHGPNAQGVTDRGPSLIGVGSASVEFQVTSGRMPATRQEAQIERKPPQLSDEDARRLGQYIQELGGGPQLPSGSQFEATGEGAIARGGELFRVNCASCHGNAGGGGALSSGKFAPSLHDADQRQIYAAMLTGPQNMPIFGDNQLTPEEKREVIAYIENLKQDRDPGGWGIGRVGPVAEGLAIFLVGMVALVFTALWIAGKS
jgi:ubiquinol-cytochrome c reductase cytochrome c subunit